MNNEYEVIHLLENRENFIISSKNTFFFFTAFNPFFKKHILLKKSPN